jgi:hypothetical protein
MSETTTIGKSEVSRQVYRQANRDNTKRKPSFRGYYNAGFIKPIVPIIPVGATLSPDSKIPPENIGKVPGIKRANGWVGLADWTEHEATLDDLRRWYKMAANVGIQTRYFPALDLDVDDKALCREIEKLGYEKLGPAPRRTGSLRSPRCLLMYRGEPMRKRRVAFMVGTTKCAVELLGDGQQFVAEGKHPKGGEYKFPDWHPCDGKPEDLTEIDGAKVDAFFAALGDLLNMLGYPVASDNGSSAATGKHRPIGSPELMASDPADVLALLKACSNADNNYDEFIRLLAAIKSSFGETAEDFYPQVEAWALTYEENTPEVVRDKWNSFRDAALGWSYLEAWGRSHGYNEDAQRAFADTPQPAEAPHSENAAHGAVVSSENPDGTIPENALDRMVARFIYCTELDRYFDTTTRAFISEKAVNVCSTLVAAYGKTGTNSAAAQLQNHPDARRVATPTYRPGKPMLITEAGKLAVNTWRPSDVVPAKNVSDADVKPWLTLCDILFGNATPEREHFLNWWAHNFQKPGRKIGHAIALTSGQGFGKDTLLKPLFKGLGAHNVASIDTTALANSFNFYLRFQIVYVQEAKMGGRHRDLYNYLKPFISAQATGLAVNEKNLPQYFLPNIQNWLVTSNHDNALALEDDDRRFWVHRAVAEEAPSDEFFTELHAWYKTGGIEKIAGWLLQRDLSGFNPMAKPRSTAAKRAMLELSQPAPVLWLREKLMTGGSLAARRVVTVRELRSRGREWDAPEPPTEKHVTAALKAEGFKAAHRVRLGNDVDRLWARGIDGSTTADAMRTLYRSETEGPSCEAA